jgi:hypothetical protein
VDLVRERYNRIRRISGEDEDAETRVRRQARIR